MNTTFSIYDFLKGRPLSYSAFSSFLYNPEQWYQTYILGIRQESAELAFGSYVDKRIQTDPSFLPKLPRYEHMQYSMKVMLGKDIPLVGIPDGLNLTKSKELSDFKTGRLKWDKKRADETDQLTWYLLLIYITLKHKPEKFRCFIHWLPTVKTESGDFKVTIEFIKDIDDNIRTFETKRTMTDVLQLISRIKVVLGEMQEYVRNHE